MYHPSSERELVSLRYTLNSDFSSRLAPPGPDVDAVYEIHVTPATGQGRAGRLKPFIDLIERNLGSSVAVNFRAGEPATPLQVINLYELALALPQMADHKPLSYRQALCTVIGIRDYLCGRDPNVEFCSAGSEHLFRTTGPCPLHPDKHGWLEIDEYPEGRPAWRCSCASGRTDLFLTGDLIDLACELENLTPAGTCATLLERYQLVPWIREAREDAADRMWRDLRGGGLSDAEQELRDKLWFPELVDRLIVQAQSSLAAGRTLSESRRVDGFLKPVIEMQEETADRELVRFALNETVRKRVCERQQSGRWSAYPRAIIRNRRTSGSVPVQQAPAELATRELLQDELHLSKETVDYFELHADTNEQRLVIPMHDQTGVRVGSCLRALWEKACCEHCGAEVTAQTMSRRVRDGLGGACPNCGQAGLAWLAYQHPRYWLTPGTPRGVYNLHGAGAMLSTDDALYVADNYADCWVIHEGGHPATVSISGLMRPEQADVIVRTAAAAGKPVVIVPDFDRTGITATEKSIQMLRDANPDLEIRVADQCPRFWGTDGAATSVSKAAAELGIARAVAPLSYSSHWAVWMTRLIVTLPADTPLTSDLLAQQKERLTGIVAYMHERRMNGDVSLFEAITQILIEAWAARLPRVVVKDWIGIITSSGHDILFSRDSWIERHGSPALKHAVKRGYDISELYAEELARFEFGDGVQLLRPGAGSSQQMKKRNHPSKAELEQEMQVLNRGIDERQVRIVFYEPLGQGAVVVDDWQGQFKLLIPVRSASSSAAA